MTDPVAVETLLGAATGSWNVRDAGQGSLGSFLSGGIVRKNGVPGSYRVIVYSMNPWGRPNNTPVAVTQSDANGDWQVDGLNPNGYYLVIVSDKERQLNAGVLDNQQPEVLP